MGNRKSQPVKRATSHARQRQFKRVERERLEQEWRDKAALEKQPWYVSITRANQRYQHMRYTHHRDNLLREQHRLQAIQEEEEPEDSSPPGAWTWWANLAVTSIPILQLFTQPYSALTTGMPPGVAGNASKPSPEPEQNGTARESSDPAQSYVSVPQWILSKFYSTFGGASQPGAPTAMPGNATGEAPFEQAQRMSDDPPRPDTHVRGVRDTEHQRRDQTAHGQDLRERHDPSDDVGEIVHSQTSGFMTTVVGLFPSRRQLAELVLKEAGYDPAKHYGYEDTTFAAPESITANMDGIFESTMPLLDLYLENSIIKLPIFQRKLAKDAKEIFDELPDIDDVFEINARAHGESAERIISEKIVDKLAQFGVDHAESTSIMGVRAYIKDSIPGQFGAAHHFSYEGDRGYVMKVETGMETKYFAITIHDDTMVYRMPGDANLRAHWIKAHKQYFFKDGVDLDDVFRITTTEVETNLDSTEAADNISAQLWGQIFPTLKLAARKDTKMEEFIHMFRGMMFPGYDIGKALRDGDQTQALIYFGWEIIPYVGEGGVRMVKVVNRGRKWAKKMIRTKKARKSDAVGEGAETGGNSANRAVNGARADELNDALQQGEQSAVQSLAEPAGDIEGLRSFPDKLPLLTTVMQERQRSLERLAAGDSWVQYFMDKEKTHIGTATRYIKNLLERHGYKTKIRLLATWGSLKNDLNNTPKIHTVVLAKHENSDGILFAIDGRSTHFKKSNTNSFNIDPEENWARMLRDEANLDLRNGVVKYADFDTFAEAKAVSREWHSATPGTDLGAGVSVLGGSSKYIDAVRSAPKAPTKRKRARFKKYIVDGVATTYDRAKDAYGYYQTWKTVRKIAKVHRRVPNRQTLRRRTTRRPRR
jgi:hypothetical protein